jgi:hypothetical protein
MREPHPIGGTKAPFTELIPLFVASARRVHPPVSLEIVTDQDTSLPDGFDVVWRRNIDLSALMLERARAQEELTRGASRGDAIAFLDTDTLILRDLRHVFDESFDVGVTIRDNPIHDFERRMPYNNGVIFADCSRSGAASSYFSAVRNAIEELDESLWAWSGNQFVVRDALGHHPPGSTIERFGARVRVFACTTHNYTPAVVGEDLEGKHLLHFRGDAKALMPQFARTA